jgi:hypothetical protein
MGHSKRHQNDAFGIIVGNRKWDLYRSSIQLADGLNIAKRLTAISHRYIVRSEGSPPRIEGGGLRYFSFDIQKWPANFEFNDI